MALSVIVFSCIIVLVPYKEEYELEYIEIVLLYPIAKIPLSNAVEINILLSPEGISNCIGFPI